MVAGRDPNDVAEWTLYQARLMTCDKKWLGGKQKLSLKDARKVRDRKKELEDEDGEQAG